MTRSRHRGCNRSQGLLSVIESGEHGLDLFHQCREVPDDRGIDDPLVNLVIRVRRDRPHPCDFFPRNARMCGANFLGHMSQVLSDRFHQMREPRALDRIGGPAVAQARPPLDRLPRVQQGLLEVPARAVGHRASPYPVQCQR